MGDYTQFQQRLKKWRFKIVHLLSNIEISTPIGWDDIKLSLTRNDTAKTMFRSYSAQLQYIFNGALKLIEIESDEGILAESTLVVDKINNNTGVYDNVLTAKHDYVEFMELTENKKGVSIPLVDTMFNEKLKNRESINVPFDRPSDLDNNTIDAGVYQDATILGREFGGKGEGVIYKDVLPDDPLNVYDFNIKRQFSMFTEFENVKLLPDFQDVPKLPQDTPLFGTTTADCFYYIDGGSAELHVKFKIRATSEANTDTFIYLYKGTFDSSGNYVGATSTRLLKYEIIGFNANADFEYDVELVGGQGLFIYTAIPTITPTDWKMHVLAGMGVEVTYISRFEETQCKVALPHEVGDYLATALTGESGSFRSNYFGRTDLGYDEDGAGALIGITNGKLLRGFDIGYLPSEDDSVVKAQLAFNFKEFFENFYKVRNVTYEVVIEDGKSIIVADLQKNIFKTTVTHEFEFIEKGTFERVNDLRFFYSSIKAGYINQADDLVSGLEEYNNAIYHSTILSNIDNELDLISTYSAATIRIEKQRRRPAASTSTEQLSGDSTVFLIDLVRDGDGYIQRTDEGIADVVGLEGLETYMNLLLTPKSMFWAHDWEINTGLAKYPNSIVKFNTSDKTTDLQILLDGETKHIIENADVVAGSLSNPIWTGKKVNFNTAIGLTDFLTMRDDANGLLAYPAPYDSNDLNYGWIDDVTTDAKDKEFNASLREANPPDVATDKVLGTDKDEAITTDNDELIGVN